MFCTEIAYNLLLSDCDHSFRNILHDTLYDSLCESALLSALLSSSPDASLACTAFTHSRLMSKHMHVDSCHCSGTCAAQAYALL